ncbi:MAG TPA: DNRLRE domain-containing protein, partial [Anaerolineales bacterium]|nr:DNRLRE domain-containing protein [Anaerolineales bacterium]
SFYTFNPTADATIREDRPNNNYGSDTTLETDNSPAKNFLLTFDITGVGNRPIVKATLRLYNVDASGKGGDFRAVADTSWSESVVTWNDAPSANAAIVASLGAVAANNWYELDVTRLIQADGVYSLRVTSTADNGADFDSREGANPPQLVLEVSNGASTSTPAPTSVDTAALTLPPSATALPNGYVRFAVIGDYGSGDQAEEDVATLVKSWNPDFIITSGDNNYPLGEAATIDKNIGKYYHEYIYPYIGSFGSGASSNRFFPVLGNHDWNTGNIRAYLDYFTLPNNERYYDFTQGPLHCFMLDSDPREPDGIGSGSTQALWLQNQLAASTATWNIVVMHHSPYSSGVEHGSDVELQWPYADWGADVVLSGHDHEYERLLVNNLPYIVNGLGGASLYAFGAPLAESQVRFNDDHGAMLVEANADQITFKFYSLPSILVDTYMIKASGISSPLPTPTLTLTSSP